MTDLQESDSHSQCTATVTPPAHEVPFSFMGRGWVALLWWCDVDRVWDTVVYEVRRSPKEGREPVMEWAASGVSWNRFVPVQWQSGKCERAFINKISTETKSFK